MQHFARFFQVFFGLLHARTALIRRTLIFAGVATAALIVLATAAAAAESHNGHDATEESRPNGRAQSTTADETADVSQPSTRSKSPPPAPPPPVKPDTQPVVPQTETDTDPDTPPVVPPVVPPTVPDIPPVVPPVDPPTVLDVPPVVLPPVVPPVVLPPVVPPVVVPDKPAPPVVPVVGADEFKNAPAFSVPIKANPVLDPMSSTWAAWLGAPGLPFGPAHALLYAFGLPVYYADSSTPRVHVIVDNEPGWGTNDLSQQLVPMPASVAANSGSYGKLVIVDTVTRKVYDLWMARLVGGQWHAAWGGVYSLDGSGSSPNPDYNPTVREGVSTPTAWPLPTSRGGGSGLSSYAGVVRLREIAAGVINHALVFATAHACGPAQSGPYRFPATTTDGSYMGSDCIPQGTRIQLDPTIDVNAIPGITPGERAVARALQLYGAYVVDNSPNQLSIAFELPKPGDVDPYPAAGLIGDYFNMPNIPWTQLRVLRNWQGT